MHVSCGCPDRLITIQNNTQGVQESEERVGEGLHREWKGLQGTGLRPLKRTRGERGGQREALLLVDTAAPGKASFDPRRVSTKPHYCCSSGPVQRAANCSDDFMRAQQQDSIALVQGPNKSLESATVHRQGMKQGRS